MNLNIVLAVICSAVALVGAFCVVFQIYQMTVIDATARGLKHPKFWGVFAMNGNNSSGLLMYLIGRRKYPIINMSENNAKEPVISIVLKADGRSDLYLLMSDMLSNFSN